jgi:hypothetical protein
MLGNRWLPLAFTTGTAVALWALAAAHGYGWQMIWLPAAVAGVAWPRDRKRTLDHCLRRLRRQQVEQMTLRVPRHKPRSRTRSRPPAEDDACAAKNLRSGLGGVGASWFGAACLVEAARERHQRI